MIIGDSFARIVPVIKYSANSGDLVFRICKSKFFLYAVKIVLTAPIESEIL